MSEQNTTAGTSEETVTVLSRADGTQYTQEPFSLAKTKEIADRYRGEHNILISLPAAVPGDREATLRNILAFVAPEADFAEVLVAKVNGQGLRLDAQKAVKDFLSPRDKDDQTTLDVNGEQVRVADAPVEVVLAEAQRVADAFRMGAPRRKGAGGQKGKVAQAEAKVAKTANTALEMFRALPKALRARYRDSLIETGAVTAAQLDEIEAEGKR